MVFTVPASNIALSAVLGTPTQRLKHIFSVVPGGLVPADEGYDVLVVSRQGCPAILLRTTFSG